MERGEDGGEGWSVGWLTLCICEDLSSLKVGIFARIVNMLREKYVDLCRGGNENVYECMEAVAFCALFARKLSFDEKLAVGFSRVGWKKMSGEFRQPNDWESPE
jgi:hypothetical protein